MYVYKTDNRIFPFLCIAFSAFAEMPYRTVLRKADDHFVNREWQEAVAMYGWNAVPVG